MRGGGRFEERESVEKSDWGEGCKLYPRERRGATIGRLIGRRGRHDEKGMSKTTIITKRNWTEK